MRLHAMVSDGTRVFVLGGLSNSARPDEMCLIHVFDTSMFFRSVISSGKPPRLRTQSKSNIRTPSLTLLIPTRRLPNLRGSHPQVPRPRSNHSTQNPPYLRPTVLSLFKALPPLHRANLPPRRSPTLETQVLMIWHRNPRV